LFDGTYNLSEAKIENEVRQIISFNTENDLSKKPDHNYIKNINNRFPGTMISMRFFLEKKYLESFVEES
jgi:hypothetical protein